MVAVSESSPFFVQSNGNLGAVEIATFLGLVLFGVSLSQGYTYFQRSGGDRLSLKIFVSILLLMEAFHSFTASHTIYYDTVTRYKNAEINSYSLSANAATETLITVLVQCFFSHRIYRLSEGNLLISIACFSLAIIRFLVGLAVSAEFNWLITTTLAVGGAADILIAASMLFYLRKLASPTNLKSTTAVINRLVRWSLRELIHPFVEHYGRLIFCSISETGLITSSNPWPTWSGLDFTSFWPNYIRIRYLHQISSSSESGPREVLLKDERLPSPKDGS
ncbi:hypothetical protein BDZ97DRAFT_1768534 [Flammula alnicola]|nr:hypothetical protein BDZ97DRAFT_1768534 [Flammula alnicola]